MRNRSDILGMSLCPEHHTSNFCKEQYLEVIVDIIEKTTSRVFLASNFMAKPYRSSRSGVGDIE